MKKISLLIIALVLFIGDFQADTPVTKHALIIAIGDYPAETNWGKISSVNDVPLIRSALQKQKFEKFTILKNEQATKEGILKAFKQLQKDVQKGDIVVVHFSSHGQQIMDDNGDEIDGYDEAIVAYGAPARYDPAYKGTNHLRDEELGKQLDMIRTKLGEKGDVLVLVDACHSGTATRGPKAEAVSRGGAKPYAPSGYSPEMGESNGEVGVYEDSRTASRGAKKAPMVVISAARADQLNYEYKGAGSLSVAFNRAFDQLNSSLSYRTLFSKIVKEMSVIAPNQSPALEGDVDRKLFGGEVVNQEPYFNLTKVRRKEVRIEGGKITGLNVGTTIKIFDSETESTEGETPLASGTIYYADELSSAADLDVELTKGPESYRVFVENLSYGDISVRLSLADLPEVKASEITTGLSDFKLAVLSDSAADFKVEATTAGKLNLLNTSSGTYFSKGISSANNYEALKEVIKTYAQGMFIKNMELRNPKYNIELELIPVRVIGDSIHMLDPKDYMDEGGILVLATGEKAVMRVTNHSSFPVYFNIVDIQPDGVVNAIVPNIEDNENAEDFELGAGKSYIMSERWIEFFPPTGLETFKVFASHRPLNLTPIISTKGTTLSRNLETQMEKLFRNSYSMHRGGAVGKLSSKSKACTFSYSFRITE